MKPLYLFILFILNRAVSGICNGLHYAGHDVTAAVIALYVLTFAVCLPDMLRGWKTNPHWRWLLSIIGTAASFACVSGLYLSFLKPDWRFADIHIFTFLHQTALAGTVLFAAWNWITAGVLALAVFPSNFLQKLFVNVIPGNPWNYRGTDDPTGETWGSTLLPWLHAPRISSMWVLLDLALISVAGMVALHIWLSKRKK